LSVVALRIPAEQSIIFVGGMDKDNEAEELVRSEADGNLMGKKNVGIGDDETDVCGCCWLVGG
jgi:hypothetical protein